MMFHASIAASDPERVARVIAELWGGEIFPFSPGRRGSYIVAAGDDRGTIMEVYPHGHLIRYDSAAHAGEPLQTQVPKESSTHVAMGTVLNRDAIQAIGDREGWGVRERPRSGFSVVELWVENSVMLELLPPEYMENYLSANTIAAWTERARAAAAKAAAEAKAG